MSAVMRTWQHIICLQFVSGEEMAVSFFQSLGYWPTRGLIHWIMLGQV